MPLREDLYGRTAWSMDMGLAMALEPISMYTRVLHRATVFIASAHGGPSPVS